MTPKVTNYDIAEILKSKGFLVASEPFEMALQGNRVLILAPTAAAADMFQRSCYKKLSDTRTDFRATKWKFQFKNGGKLEIYTPSVNPYIFEGLDPKKTFYSLYR